MNVKLGEKVPPAFERLFWDMYEGRHDEYWLKGGRGSGKSSFVSLMALCLMLKDPEANACGKAYWRRCAGQRRKWA